MKSRIAAGDLMDLLIVGTRSQTFRVVVLCPQTLRVPRCMKSFGWCEERRPHSSAGRVRCRWDLAFLLKSAVGRTENFDRQQCVSALDFTAVIVSGSADEKHEASATNCSVVFFGACARHLATSGAHPCGVGPCSDDWRRTFGNPRELTAGEIVTGF